MFFGQAIAGAPMPSLFYMVTFADMAEREKNWGQFRDHPDWKALSGKPEYANEQILTKTNAWILRPTDIGDLEHSSAPGPWPAGISLSRTVTPPELTQASTVKALVFCGAGPGSALERAVPAGCRPRGRSATITAAATTARRPR